MSGLPIITKFNENSLSEILNSFAPATLLSIETRKDFTAKFPSHTRYFSNGDIPLVALINISGNALFGYDNKHFPLDIGDFVFFDDSKPHSWIFEDCNLKIFYYRFSNTKGIRITQGDYCLDSYF